ncbi:ABC-type multidrug transport system, ATPase and permease component [Pseudarthrobacter phenanthrenivorans Sphe3]|uniref:ABC-type multidrug transport system, ATPase and permease component n=1 Tax=Pseudarthrobacter phenanthrenivorans (strain DSM 18606 / JCM 16027 / LMG 23796 / Sphe3) TaxID=930171 RepID=F0MBL8_PSEPM|nr:ABC transporter ATP-binding protein [Pseudarthrobacter phenanthrenivorans]ADX72951.1 ABC-type multidrug transport system, ATPase and permease component [Pseudarthrobacter phenanthrenivorans Sphe3]
MLIGLLRRLLGAHKAQVSAIVVLQLLQAAATLMLPTLNAAIIDDGIVAGNTGVISRLGAVMAGIAAVQAAAAIAAGYLAALVAMEIGHQLRAEIFAKVQSLSSQEVAAFGTQSLTTRATNDTQQIQAFAVLVFTMLVAGPAMGLGGIVLAVQQDIALSAVVIVIVPLLLLIMVAIVRRLIPLYREGQELLDRAGGILREQIIGANVIRAFVRQDHEVRRFARTNSSLTANNLQSALLVAGMLPLIMLVVNISSVAVVWFGGHRIQAGVMDIGALAAFIAYILQILLAIMMAMYVLMTAPRAAVCAERIGAVLSTEPSVRDPDGTRPAMPGRTVWNEEPGPGRGTLQFSRVGFSYPGAEAPVLADISFTAGPGTTTAIVGSTGSGKSTLLNLIPRFLDSTAGTIRLDGVDIRDLPLDALRGAMSIVPQHSHLFSGTIGDNLRLAVPDAPDEQLWAALETAQTMRFMRELPLGLDTPLGQGGTNLSGGQRQRLCIARALLRKSPLYLFDDSFSALDYDTDTRLRQALAAELAPATVIVVAERISAVESADLILVLDGGRLVAQGTHSELLETSPTYREIADSQLALDGPL